MIPPWHILAAGPGTELPDVPDWLIAAAAAAIGLIAAAVERAGKRRQTKASEGEGDPRRRYKPLGAGPASPAPSGRPPAPIGRPIQRQPPAAGPPMAPSPLRPRPRPVRRPAPVLLEPVAEESVRVAEELRQEEQRRSRQEQERRRRLAKLQSAVGQMALGSELAPGSPGLEPAAGPPTGAGETPAAGHPVHPRVRLERNRARLAIIYHEIFSPPKALRETPEMWEL